MGRGFSTKVKYMTSFFININTYTSPWVPRPFLFFLGALPTENFSLMSNYFHSSGREVNV